MEGTDYTFSPITTQGNLVTISVTFLRSVNSVQFGLTIPGSSSIQSTNGQLLSMNSTNSTNLKLLSAPVGPILLPKLSKADVQLSQGFSSAQSVLQNQNNVFIQILQQSYVLKYMINSQMIAALMLIDQKVPMIYYLAQQVFSSTVFSYSPTFESLETTYVQPNLPFNLLIDPRLLPNQIPSQPIFRRFRMSNNFLLNNSQCILMVGILIFVQSLAFAYYAHCDFSKNPTIANRLKDGKYMETLLNRIHITLESSFLLIAISVLLQL